MARPSLSRKMATLRLDEDIQRGSIDAKLARSLILVSEVPNLGTDSECMQSQTTDTHFFLTTTIRVIGPGLFFIQA